MGHGSCPGNCRHNSIALAGFALGGQPGYYPVHDQLPRTYGGLSADRDRQGVRSVQEWKVEEMGADAARRNVWGWRTHLVHVRFRAMDEAPRAIDRARGIYRIDHR